MHVKHASSASMALLKRSSTCPRATLLTSNRLAHKRSAQPSLTVYRNYSDALHNYIGHDGSYTKLDFVPEVAVVGGGLSGLASAYYAAKRLPAHTKITLYESSDRLGGWIKTDRVQVDVGGKSGVVPFERGPRTLSSLHTSRWRYDDYVLYDLAVDLGLPVTFPQDKPRYICYDDRLVNLSGFSFQRDNILWSRLRNKLIMPILNILKYKWTNPEIERIPEEGSKYGPLAVPDRSVGQWMRDMSGSDVLSETMVSAMLHGIYGGDVWRLSANSVFENLFQNTMRPVSGNSARVIRNQYTTKKHLEQDPAIREFVKADKGSLITFGHHGLDTLPRAMEEALRSDPNVTIKLGHNVKSLSYDSKTKKALVSCSL
jgi:oxygen-dependent protoporphyrinogen oxidase